MKGTFWKLYIKQHKKVMFYIAVCYALLWLFCWLYHLPIQAIVYPSAVCILIGIIIAWVDILHTKRKYGKLEQLQNLVYDMMQDFPEVSSIEDKEYQRIIELMEEEQVRIKTDLSAKYEDMVEYYTIWAHQIKTPIAAMRLQLQKEDSNLSRQLMADLNRIEQYVEMVMIYLRLDSSATDYVIKEYTLDSIVKQAVRKYASEFICRKIKLDYRLQDDEIKVITDEKWLCFVIEQILSNALKYSEKGTITVYLEEPQTLCIQDTGIGIAPSDLPRVFEKGYTGYNGRNDKRASGIGLFLSKQICDRLGHTIQIDSLPDRGTTVRINLYTEKMTLE